MTRIWHPWHLWEDYKVGFYGNASVSKEKNNLENYANIFRDIPEFERILNIIITEWKYSCEHNLTNSSLNRIAYMGQAAAALKYGIPHMVGSAAYNCLTEEQKALADNAAAKYISLWESKNVNIEKV